MADYMANLRHLLDRDDEIYWPTHGPAITDPKTYLQALIAHREEREGQILECLARGVSRIEKMVPEIYVGLDPRFNSGRRTVGVFASRQTCRGRPGHGRRSNFDRHRV